MDGSSAARSRDEKASGLAHRAYIAWITSLYILVAIDYSGRLGPWVAWCSMVAFGLLSLGAGIYALGLKRGAK